MVEPPSWRSTRWPETRRRHDEGARDSVGRPRQCGADQGEGRSCARRPLALSRGWRFLVVTTTVSNSLHFDQHASWTLLLVCLVHCVCRVDVVTPGKVSILGGRERERERERDVLRETIKRPVGEHGQRTSMFHGQYGTVGKYCRCETRYKSMTYGGSNAWKRSTVLALALSHVWVLTIITSLRLRLHSFSCHGAKGACGMWVFMHV